MIKRRSGSIDNPLGGSFREDNNSSGDEYFVPLVDESRGSYNDYQDDHSQISYLSSDDQRLSPTLPLHRSAMPANPQSPGDDARNDTHYQRSPYTHTPPRPQRRYSNGSRPNSPLDHDHNNNNNNGSSTNSNNDNGVLPLRSRLVFTAHKRKSTFSFAVTSFCLLGFLLYGNARSSLRKTVREVEDLVVFSEKLHRKLRFAEREMKILEKELNEMEIFEARREDEELEQNILDRSSVFANPELNEQKKRHEEKLRAAQTQADYFRKQVVAISKKDTIDKFGDGDIRVEMDLIFPPVYARDGSLVPDNGPKTIVMEMAPLDLMPHSVYTFLEMVSEGLIDGCSFVTNNEHTLKTAPMPHDSSSPQLTKLKTRQFYDADLESVAFQEYSPEFPHKKYTVGFAGNGSPSFYINTEDNSSIHEDEPCFAKIISGFDTVQRLDELPRNEIMLKQRVGIKAVHIL